MRDSIEEFYSLFPQSIREIIDDLSGVIFEEFPNVKEKIQRESLYYRDIDRGKFIEIKPSSDEVKITFLKTKQFLIFKDSKDINFDKIRELLL